MATIRGLHRLWLLPETQVILVGFMLFTLPGMFDAVSGLGAGGSVVSDVSITDHANAALYACFAVVGFMAGSIVNTLGPRFTMFLGGVGYTVYMGALWNLDRHPNAGFVVFGGVLCGISAALLWSVHGMIVMSYPKERSKAKAFATTWSLLSLGATLGGLIALVENIHTARASAISTGTYAGFFVVMMVGIASSVLLVDPRRVIRTDGSHLESFAQTNFKTEMKELTHVFRDKRMMMLVPAFFASNFFYSYQFRLNAHYFSLRARALNSMLYWLTQVFGSFFIGCILDNRYVKRRNRGMFGLAVVVLFVVGTWSGGTVFQVVNPGNGTERVSLDWSEPGFAGPFVLYLCYGIADAMWQTWCYWIMGSLTNESYRLARYAGFYKGVQSAGAAISFGIDAARIPFLNELGANFGLIIFSIPFMAWVSMQTIETNYGLEDAVIVPAKDPLVTCPFHLLNHPPPKQIDPGTAEFANDTKELDFHV